LEYCSCRRPVEAIIYLHQNNPQLRALILSNSSFSGDPRVLRQVQWLVEENWCVDGIGIGFKPTELNGEYFKLRQPNLAIRMLIYVFCNSRRRSKALIEHQIDFKFSEYFSKHSYDLLIANDTDFLPFVEKALVSTLIHDKAHLHLDLHEFFEGQGHGFVWKLLFRRYQSWLNTFIPSDIWNTRSTVSRDIAVEYESALKISKVAIVLNTPRFSDLSPTELQHEQIHLVYLGKGDSARSLDLLIASMEMLDGRFYLNFMLTGSKRYQTILRKKAIKSSASDRIYFHKSVQHNLVANSINKFDLSLIFFPPKTKNLLYSLPNKFFESVQGRLGVVIGESPSMVSLVNQFGNGIIVNGWGPDSLANSLNSLTASKISELKQNSNSAASVLSAENEKMAFLSALGRV